MPSLKGGGRGDLMVQMVVDIPTKLTKEQRRLLTELAQSLGEAGQSSGDEGIFKKVFGK
jgi:molecular chaperone DnaJ